MRLDALDRQLLQRIQENSRETTEQLAMHLGLSASAIQRRLKRLRASNIIEKEVAVLSPTVIGEYLTMVVDVEFEQENIRLIQEFKALMHSREEVTQCYQTAGRTDFVLIVIVRSMQAFNAFAEACFLSNKHLKRYQTNVVLDRVKVGLQLPISTEEGD